MYFAWFLNRCCSVEQLPHAGSEGSSQRGGRCNRSGALLSIYVVGRRRKWLNHTNFRTKDEKCLSLVSQAEDDNANSRRANEDGAVALQDSFFFVCSTRTWPFKSFPLTIVWYAHREGFLALYLALTGDKGKQKF